MSGKGRGRGWLKHEQPEIKPGIQQQSISGNPTRRNSTTITTNATNTSVTNVQYDNIVLAIGHFTESDDGILLNKKFHYVKEKFADNCESSNDVQNAMEYIYNKALSDSSFTNKFTIFVSLNTFRDLTICDFELRTRFLNLLQASFENAKLVHTQNPKNFQNYVKLLIGFYERAKMRFDKNYVMLAPAMLYCLALLLDSDLAEDIELFTTQINVCGIKLIEDAIDTRDLVIKIRSVLCSETRTLSGSSKVWLLLAMDLLANEFRILQPDLLNFYQMKLGCKEIFSYKMPLTVECSATVNNKLTEYSSDVNVLEIDTSINKLHVGNTDKNMMQKSPVSSESQDIIWNGNVAQLQSNSYKVKQSAGRPILGAGARSGLNRNCDQAESHSGLMGHWGKHKEDSTSLGMPRKPRKGWEHDDRFENDYN